MIELIKNDKVLQMVLFSIIVWGIWSFTTMACKLKKVESDTRDAKHWQELDARIERNSGLESHVRNPLVTRRPNYQARRLRMNRGRRS